MGNFLVIIPCGDVQVGPDRLFRSATEAAQCLGLDAPSGILETKWVRAAFFPRLNGSGTPIVSDPETGSWLLAVGTWFHTAGYACGAESNLLRRYLAVGPALLGRELEGFFVLVIGDARTRETVLITDLFGSCHCFIRLLKLGIALSGSSLLLAALAGFNLDPVGCQEFLHTGVIYEDRTIYREVRKLGPASVFRFAEGTLKSAQRYWSITELSPESLELRPAVKTLWEKVTQAARRVGSAFDRPVCDLTGGYDSRALVAAFLAAGVRFSTVVSGPSGSPDVVVSRGLAELAGLPHVHLVPEERLTFDQISRALPMTDGEYDLLEYIQVLRVHQTLMEQFDIGINGSFGEVARGYWWELLLPRTGARRKLDARKVARLRYAASASDTLLFPPETRLELVSHFTDVIERTNAGLSLLPNTLQMDHVYLAMRMQRWQGRIASSTNRIWPCLSPFLFRSVLETMLQTKARFRRRSLLVRQMLAEFQPLLAGFPLEHGYPAVPVRWGNLFRFRPLVGHYARKILCKAIRMTGARLGLAASPASYLPARLQLWREADVQQLLRPQMMGLGCLLDGTALRNFLARSREQNFPYGNQWARLLSLEYTLSVLKRTETKETA